MQPKFTIGQTVSAKPFTDCFGEFHAEIPGLTVTEIRQMFPPYGNPSIGPYYRITAERQDGDCRYVCGAERYFTS